MCNSGQSFDQHKKIFFGYKPSLLSLCFILPFQIEIVLIFVFISLLNFEVHKMDHSQFLWRSHACCNIIVQKPSFIQNKRELLLLLGSLFSFLVGIAQHYCYFDELRMKTKSEICLIYIQAKPNDYLSNIVLEKL